jgi:diaminopimelate decarboxylase
MACRAPKPGPRNGFGTQSALARHNARPMAVYPQASEVRDGRLTIGGCDARELAREFGTPAYVVAEDDLRAQARAFTAAMAAHHPRGEVIFASKAFSCTPVLEVFEQEGLSVDVASGGELDTALRAGFTAERIVVHGNAKSLAELKAATALRGARIVIDNQDELERLDALAKPCPVLVRVTPGVIADTHHSILTGHAESKFGFPPRDAQTTVERLKAAPWAELRGLHIHLGSQLFDLAPWREALRALAPLGPFDELDLGGGLAVAYTDHQRPPAPDEYIAALAELAGPGVNRLSIEPGRALVARACVTLYTVEGVKDLMLADGPARFVAVDGGMSDNLRPMLYDAVYEADLVDRMGAGGAPCAVVGKHCESGDVLIRETALPDPRPGDVLVTPVTGAYGYAMASNYNGIPRAPVVFCAGGDARVVVRRETYDDLHGRDV